MNIKETYEKIEKTVVGGYKQIEEGAVGGFAKVTDKFVEKLFTHDGETVEAAKERLRSSIPSQKDSEE